MATLFFALPFSVMSSLLARATPPAFEFGYSAVGNLEKTLADPRVLAVFGFHGCPRPLDDDPRFLQVPLQIHGAPVLEVWRSPLPVTHGRSNDVAWAHNGQVLFGALEIDEADQGIEEAAAVAYARLASFLDECGYPHLLRTWNYLDAIIEGEGDEERYRRFCVGRARGMRTLDESCLPAATCIGRHDGVRRLQVYWLCARDPGQPLDNPRQVNPWHYPRQYGLQPPSFSRALLPPVSSGLPLLQSGTAAIIGHDSQHREALSEQLHETLANLQTLIDVARQHRPSLSATPNANSLFKVYVRRIRDLDTVAALLQDLPQHVPYLLLHAEVCRRELLVEIESLHG